MILKMNLGPNSYDIVIKKDVYNNINEEIKAVYDKQKIYIITDSNVGPLYLNKIKNELHDFKVYSVCVEAGEQSKSFETYKEVLTKLLDLEIKRGELLIALGGGVIGDLTGFVASSIYRGNPYIQIPTSLLAQMDSSIGGKTGIDFYGRKNIIGAFKQPLKVIIDPNALETLPKVEFNNGMGELIKHGCIGNRKLLDMLLNSDVKITEEIIYESLCVKKNIVEIDPFDLKERMFLNFGHTFGHIVELEGHLRHGEAVANGMLMAIQMGIDLGLTNPSCYDTLKKILLKYDLPIKNYDYKEIIKSTVYDKKNIAGEVSFILISDFGAVFAKKFSESELLNYECKN